MTTFGLIYGKARKSRSQRDYNLDFKLTVISRIEKGEMTYIDKAQKAYGIQRKSAVLIWFRKLDNLDLTKPTIRSPTPKKCLI